MEAIKIHERELRDIIRESVYRILDEVRGALDERMRGLAETIWNRIEGGTIIISEIRNATLVSANSVITSKGK